MSFPQQYYIKYLGGLTQYRVNWLPDGKLRLGDIGKLEDGLFTLYTNLEQQGIKFISSESPSSLDLDYTSSESAKINFDIDAGSAIPGNVMPKGKVSIQFSKKNAVVFQMSKAKSHRIDDLANVEKAVLQHYDNKDWPKEWVVITELILTDNATIIISTSNENSIDLACDIPAGMINIPLADPSIKLKLLKETGTSTKILAASQVTPFYKVMGVKKPFLQKREFRTKADLTDTEIKFQDLPFDEKEFGG